MHDLQSRSENSEPLHLRSIPPEARQDMSAAERTRRSHGGPPIMSTEPQKPSAGPELADVARYADAVKRWNMAEPLRWITECEGCKTRYENGCGSTECCGSVQYIVWEGNPHNA